MKGAEAAEPLRRSSPLHPSSFSAASQPRHRPPVWANLSDALHNPPPRGDALGLWRQTKRRILGGEGVSAQVGLLHPPRHCCLLMARTHLLRSTLKRNSAFLRRLTPEGRLSSPNLTTTRSAQIPETFIHLKKDRCRSNLVILKKKKTFIMWRFCSHSKSQQAAPELTEQ